VTPSENLKARRFFTDDGKRKTKVAKAEKKVKVHVPPSEKSPKPLPKPVKTASPARGSAPPLKPSNKKLPDDPDEYYNADTFGRKLKYLYKLWPPFKAAWKSFRAKHPDINQKNFLAKFKEATGKGLEKRMGDHPASWNTRLTAALYEIDRRLKK